MVSQRKRSFVSRLLFCAYLVILFCAPLPLGSNRPWAWSVLELAIFVLAAGCLSVWIFSALILRRSELKVFGFRSTKLALILFFAWLSFLLLQFVPLPLGFLSSIASGNADWWIDVYAAQGSGVGRISADVYASQVFLLKQIAYVCFFSITLYLVDNRKRLKFTLGTLIFAALFQALYGLAAYFMRDAFPFWTPKWLGHDWASGTFLNKNHYAAVLSMGIALSIGASLPLLAQMTHSRAKGIKKLLLSFSELTLSPKACWLGVLFILLTAFFIAHSRGALLALFVAVGGWLIVGSSRDKNSVERRSLPILTGVAIVASLWLGFSGVFGQLFSLSAASGRLALWSESVQLIPEFWLFGTGGGTFETVATQIKTQQLGDYTFDYLHNDHLQYLIEQGVLGAGLFYSAVFVSWMAPMRQYWASQRGKMSSERRALQAGILIATSAFMLHGFVDFNFYIPSNTLWFFTLLALGLCATHSRANSRVLVSPRSETSATESKSQS